MAIQDKIAYVKKLADETLDKITSNTLEWRKFLDFSAKLYKYSFSNKILIYAQRPDATAVADYDTWNSKEVNRRITRNPKSIAIFDKSQNNHALKYLFDVSDTFSHYYPAPTPWEMRSTDIPIVKNGLKSVFHEMSDKKELDGMIYNYVNENAINYLQKIENDFNSVENLDTEYINKVFRVLLIESVGYTVCERLGIDKGVFNSERSFERLHEIVDNSLIKHIGVAISELSEDFLRVTEKIIRYERGKEYERNNIHRERRNTLPEYSNQREQPGQRTNVEIRTNGGEIPRREQFSQVSISAVGRQADGTFTGDRQASEGLVFVANGAVEENDPTATAGGHNGGNSVQQSDILESGGNSVDGNSISGIEKFSGTDKNAVPFFMAESSFTYENLYKLLTSTVATDTTVLNSAVNSDKLNTSIEIKLFLKKTYNSLFADVINFPEIQDKSEAIAVIGNHLLDNGNNNLSPTIEQLYSVVLQSNEYKNAISKKEQETQKPIFVEDADHAFSILKNNKDLYNDGDIIGYDKNGVEYSLSIILEEHHMLQKSKVTPTGEIIGNIPQYILENIDLEAAKNYDISTETKNKHYYFPRNFYLEYHQEFVRLSFYDKKYAAFRKDFSKPIEAKIELSNAIDRIAEKLIIEDEELGEEYYNNPKLKDKLINYVFKRIFSDFVKEVKKLDRLFNKSNVPPQNTQAHKNYQFLNEFAPQILSSESDYMRFSAGEGFMPLSIEKVGENRIAISHYYEQNGNLMADPDMVMVFDNENKTLSPRTYQQDSLSIYQTNENDMGEITNSRLEKELLSFTAQWFKNISEQGFVLQKKKAYSLDTEITLNYDENSSIISIDGEDKAVQDYITKNNIIFSEKSEKEKAFTRTVNSSNYDNARIFLSESDKKESNFEQRVETIIEENKNLENYTEPFVVIQWSESKNFNYNEKSTFYQADKKFKEVEKQERQETFKKYGEYGDFNKTVGVIFFKEYDTDTELSHYIFKYDVGDYNEWESGLYNHVKSLWDYYQVEKEKDGITDAEIEDANRMLGILEPHVYMEKEINTETITENSDNNFDKTPKPVFIEDDNDIEYEDILKYNDGDIIGYNAEGAEFKVRESGGVKYLESTNDLLPIEDILNTSKIPNDIKKQIRIANGLDISENDNSDGNVSFPTPFPITSREWKYLSKDYKIENEDGSRSILTNENGATILLPVVIDDKNGYETKKYTFEEHSLKYSCIAYTEQEALQIIKISGHSLKYIKNLQGVSIRERTEATNNIEITEKAEKKEYNLLFSNIGDGVVTFNTLEKGENTEHKELANIRPNKSIIWLDDTLPDEIELKIEDFARTNNIPSIEMFSPENTDINNEITAENSDGNFSLETPLATEIKPDSQMSFFQPKTITKSQIKQNNDADYKITEADELGKGGIKTKFKQNVEAIQIIKLLDVENRLATPEEQKKLVKYVGFGGMAQAFDSENAKWEKEHTELKELLTESEYNSARGSVLNAHYTSPTVINSMYSALEQFGFEGGKILEPSMGIGHFFGVMPSDIKEKSELYGVELDEITGKIAKQLYPNTDIKIQGFEKIKFKDNQFDVAISNVPFGNYSLHDKRYEKRSLMIHDYFFAKSLDLVHEGGIVAFITSKGTLDKANPAFRLYLAQRAELLGAIRLPYTAFSENANTEVTTDIIFLKKRSQAIDVKPDWVYTGKNEDGIPINEYYINNPHMLLGKMEYRKNMYGNDKDTALIPFENMDLKRELQKAVNQLNANVYEQNSVNDEDKGTGAAVPADLSVKNFCYTVVDDKLFYRENDIMTEVNAVGKRLERITGMIEMRKAVRNLIDMQNNNCTDLELKAEQENLNTAYALFTKKNGYINESANTRVFHDDADFPLLLALENKENGQYVKSDIFFKRTIKPNIVITHVDKANEALLVSLNERGCIDLGYMNSITQKPPDELIKDLQGIIFQNPQRWDGSPYTNWETADEYLSGYVKDKLTIAEIAAEDKPELFSCNVEYLKKVQPELLTAADIGVRLGSSWIPPEYIKQFMFEILKTPDSAKNNIQVSYIPKTATWNIEGKSEDKREVEIKQVYGTDRMSAYNIIENTLNQKAVSIYDTINERRVFNRGDTIAARERQELIKQEFQTWIWKEPKRRETLEKKYNNEFNNIKLREFDGSHLTFPNMNPEKKLMSYQVDAAARSLYSDTNSLFAHCVGAGKTYEMIASGMERKRLGIAHKNMYVVPNGLIAQWGAEFMALYPNANILLATKKDFQKQNRKRFTSRIATGDYDAIIIGHSSFGKIPISKERQEKQLNDELDEIVGAIELAQKDDNSKLTVKMLEGMRNNIEATLEKLNDQTDKDDVLTFEELGVDSLYIDESHKFKNLYVHTKMRNIAGIGTSRAKRASDLFSKVQYINEITNNRGTVFASGTPISNTMSELFTIQRYLQHDELKMRGIDHFDA